MPASAPWAWMASTVRRSAGMSWSSQMRCSMKGVISEVWWISACSVHTTPQPPSALMPRMVAWAVGSR
jgi:hypothetical protein